MQCGVFDIQRITQYQVTKGTGAEIVSGDFIEEISFNSESKILKREVLPVNATAPIVILDASPIAVICPSVGSKEPEGPFVWAEIACRWRRRRCNDLFRGGYASPANVAIPCDASATTAKA